MATPLPINTARFTLGEVLAATGGRLAGRVLDEAQEICGICTDTRTLLAGNAFVALPGERFDGHDHLAGARDAGATLAIVERPSEPVEGLVRVRVRSSLEALRALAAAHLDRWRRRGGRVLALTGSAGKTTTKDAIASLLGAAEPGVFVATVGNLNNLVGAPLTALSLADRHRYAVLELGTSERGEIPKLAAMARPDVALVTLISAAHTEGIGDLEAVAVEKLALFVHAAERAVRVGNVDDVRIRGSIEAYRGHVGYGHYEGADLRIDERSLTDSHRQRVVLYRRRDDTALDVVSPLIGEPGASCVAGAVASVEALTGWTLDGPFVSEALHSFDAGRRMRVVRLEGLVVVDDSYNSNPASCAAALESAAELAEAEDGRLIAVLGEMRELGQRSESEHADIGRRAAKVAAALVAVGEEARPMAMAASEQGGQVTFAADAEEAQHAAQLELRAGDVVLVKGSRSVGAESIVDGLVESWGGAS